MENQNLRILLIEDDEDDYVLVRDLLNLIPGSGHTLDWVKTYDEGLDALRGEYHDVCLLDYRLGERNGMGILKWTRDNGCSIPVVFLTGQGGYTVDVEAMQAGAADYLSKGEATPSLLERSIRNAVLRRRAEEALRESEERFRFMAESTGDALYRLRYDTMQYDYLSPSIEIITGYSPEEIERIGFGSLVLRIDWEGVENVAPVSLKQRRLNGVTGEYRADYLIRSRASGLKWLSDHSVPWMDRFGKHTGSIGILTDITERKLAEQAIRESEKQLRLLSSKLLSVQEAERVRLARDLHDTIGQSLAAVKYGVESALNAKGKAKAVAMARSIEPVVPLLQELIDSVRRIYMDLRPTVLDDFGVIAAVKWLGREFEAAHGQIAMETHIHVEEEQVPAALKSVIFRIAQDALSNIARHSMATRAVLVLQANALGIELEVRDNGIGFDVQGDRTAENPLHGGLGICSMRERTRLSGGVFSIHSEIGTETAVRAFWSSSSRADLVK